MKFNEDWKFSKAARLEGIFFIADEGKFVG